MKSFAERTRETRRLGILQLLMEAPGYQLGQYLIYESLPTKGVAASADQVAVDIAWLAEQGMVERIEFGGSVFAKLMQPGRDCAEGLTTVPGIARPGP